MKLFLVLLDKSDIILFSFFMSLLSINSARKDNLEINEYRIREKTNFQQIVLRIYIDVLWQNIFFFTNGLNT